MPSTNEATARVLVLGCGREADGESAVGEKAVGGGAVGGGAVGGGAVGGETVGGEAVHSGAVGGGTADSPAPTAPRSEAGGGGSVEMTLVALNGANPTVSFGPGIATQNSSLAKIGRAHV